MEEEGGRSVHDRRLCGCKRWELSRPSVVFECTSAGGGGAARRSRVGIPAAFRGRDVLAGVGGLGGVRDSGRASAVSVSGAAAGLAGVEGVPRERASLSEASREPLGTLCVLRGVHGCDCLPSLSMSRGGAGGERGSASEPQGGSVSQREGCENSSHRLPAGRAGGEARSEKPGRAVEDAVRAYLSQHRDGGCPEEAERHGPAGRRVRWRLIGGLCDELRFGAGM
mmetsp:Transcript_60402/g.124191  ORF Transcript_60402/g.124191 Transcript_60402/m.124191 type:complete len:225 (+) Transcript_60402:2075-2749(+)